MIPLKDDAPLRRRPLVTIFLIAANVAVFAWQIGNPGSLPHSVAVLGLVPAEFLASLAPTSWLQGGLAVESFEMVRIPTILTPLSSMFAHGSLMHIGSNMLFLWVFGANVEDAMGKGRFVIFYLLCGLAAAAAQIGFAPGSVIPMVGASGAIAGMLGAYMLLFPRARVLTLVPIFIFIRLMWLPAFLFLGLWFLLQIFGGLGTPGEGGGVAYWAHIGGFVAGLLLVRSFAGRIWRPRQRTASATTWYR